MWAVPPTIARGHPGSLMGIPSDAVTEIGKPNTIPAFIIVPNWIISKQPSLKNAQYSVQPNATQPQAKPNPVPLQAKQITISKLTKFQVRYSCFANPVSMKISNNKMFVPNVSTSHSTAQARLFEGSKNQ